MAAEDYLDMDYNGEDDEDLAQGSHYDPRDRQRVNWLASRIEIKGDWLASKAHYGIYRETEKAYLFKCDKDDMYGFWLPKSIIEDNKGPTSYRHNGSVYQVKPGKVHYPSWHNIEIVHLARYKTMASSPSKPSAQDEFKDFIKPTAQKEPTMNKVKTNHAICMFQEGYTTIAVSFLCASQVKLYTYKVLTDDIPAVGTLVIVPVNEPDDFGIQEMKMARVEDIHVVPQIDYDSNIVYRWIISKVDMTQYNSLMKKEQDFKALMVQAEKVKQRENLKKAFIELSEGSEAKSLLEQAVNMLAHSTKQQDLDL